eukprot:gb/GECG01016152.1/.p1 GENE.gb/GECG01016152.1/~~gb/GECG01016152.1/.p1  ORF type:complete len:241 (+),score=10.63 gb/GECG01016152.1/:1-723(+)
MHKRRATKPVKNRIPTASTTASRGKAHASSSPSDVVNTRGPRCADLLLETRFALSQQTYDTKRSVGSGRSSSSAVVSSDGRYQGMDCSPILFFLGARDLCSLSRVCKNLYWQAQNSDLWKHLVYRQRSGALPDTTSCNSMANPWKYLFVKYFLERACKLWFRWVRARKKINRDFSQTPLVCLDRIYRILKEAGVNFRNAGEHMCQFSTINARLQWQAGISYDESGHSQYIKTRADFSTPR